MNYFKRSTQIPNAVFDVLLQTLSEKELKVLLVVLRQTIGWIDAGGKRKVRDWISQRYFRNKTGLSGKSVSHAIDLLVEKKFIFASTYGGLGLYTKEARRGQERIYYGCTKYLMNNLHKVAENSSQAPWKNSNNTKQTLYKTKQTKYGMRSLEDIIRDRNDGQQSA